MKAQYTRSFLREYQRLPDEIQKAFDDKLEFLLKDIRHPSLRAKKIQGTEGRIWEASITMSYRITFQLIGNTVLLRKIGTHDILKHP